MPQYVAPLRQLDLSSHVRVRADVVANVRDGLAGSLLVAGIPGGGQSDLLHRVEEAALADSRGVLRLPVTPGLPPLMFSLTLAGMLGADDPGTSDPMAWARALRRAMRAPESTDQRLVLMLHNIQYLSPEDATIVESLLAVPPPDPVLIVATAESRCADGSRWTGLPTFVDRARLDERCHLVELDGLRVDDVTLLVEERFGPGASARRLIRELRSGAAGAMDDMLDWIASIDATDPNIRLEILASSRSLATLPVPERAFSRTAMALDALTEPGRSVACGLAVLGVPATVADVETVTGMTREQAADGLELAVARGLTEPIESPSGVVRYQSGSALIARSLSELTRPSLRARLHEEAAKLLQGAARPLSEEETIALGDHVLASGQPVEDGAMKCVEASARALVRRGSFGDARRQLLELDRLIASPEGQPALPDSLAVLLAETLSRSGDLEAAGEVLRTRVDAATADVQATIRRARDQVALGRDAEGWTIYEPLVMRPNPDLDPRITRARIEAARVLQTLGMLDEALRQAALACDEAEQTENTDLAIRALTTRHTITLHAGHPSAALAFGRKAYRLARRTGDTAGAARSTAAVGNALSDFSLTRGTRWTQRAIRLAEATDQFPIVSWAGIRVALCYIEQGDLVSAERMSQRIMHMDAGLHRLRPLPRSHAVLRTVHALQGKHRDDASPAVQFWHGWETLDMAHALSQEAVARYSELRLEGDLRSAYDTISIVIDQFMEVTGRGRFLLTDLIPRQVRAAVDLGDRAAAEASVTRFDEVFEQTEDFPLARAHHHLAHGQLDACRGRKEPALGHLLRAVELFGLGGYSWCHADALQATARLYISLGHLDQAAPCLDEAYAFLARAGADLRPIRQLYGQVGRRAPRRQVTGGLSEREREVARLVARGMTDAEVALALGIQRRTVTTHMHHILSKLGLHSRHGLQGRNL